MSLVKTSDIAKSEPAKQGRILVVESSQLYTTLIEGAVKEVFSGSVDIANSFDDVVKYVDRFRDEYFLALTNLVLPGAGFGEAVKYLREKDIPSVVFTSSIERDVIERIKNFGVVDYILKENVANLELVSRTVRRLDHNRRIKALVVDDSSTIRTQMRSLLSSHLFMVEEAKDGVEALEKVRNDELIQLVVTDYEMPNMDGFELIKKLRSFKDSRELAIVGMSGLDDSRLAANFIRFGADDFVSKPIRTEEFATRIAMCMDKLDLLNELMFRATTDFLTKLWNRRYFLSAAETLYSSAQRGQIDVSVAMIDLDHFKRINDDFGHEAGDEVLKEVASALKDIIRTTDLLARMGGEEFCLMAVNVDKDHREAFFNTLREAISELKFNFGGVETSITTSMGITSKVGDSLDDMINRADAALYEAKNSGRNRCVFADNIE